MNNDWRILQFVTPKIKTSYNAEKDEFYISGEAIHATTTRNGTVFSVQELQSRSQTLIGKPLLKDHNNSVDSIVGRVVAAKWDPLTNSTRFKAKVTDANARENIKNGNIQNVSVGAMVEDVEEIETEGKFTYELKGIEFLELSLVAIPADPNAGFGIAQAITAALNSKKLVATTRAVSSTPSLFINNNKSPVYITTSTNTTVKEEAPEETNMESKTADEAVMKTLSTLADALTAVTEKLAAIDKKVEAQAATVAVVEDKKPETKGIVSAAAEKSTKQEVYMERTMDGVFGIELSNFNDVAKAYTRQRTE